MSAPARLSSVYRLYLDSEAWRRQRAVALCRARYRCQVCGAPTDLDVHHNTYVRFGREDPADLIVLCRECHDRHHAAMRAVQAVRRVEQRWRATLRALDERGYWFTAAVVARLPLLPPQPGDTDAAPLRVAFNADYRHIVRALDRDSAGWMRITADTARATVGVGFELVFVRAEELCPE